MASIVVLLTITVFNIVMWVIMGLKFKKIFSTEQIMEETRETLNHMLVDINKNAERNINLIDDRIKALKAVSAEADRKVLLLKGELDKVEKSKAFVEKVQGLEFNQSSKIMPSKTAAKPKFDSDDAASQSNPKKTTRTRKPQTPQQRYVNEQAQGDLFVSNQEDLEEQPVKAQKVPFIEPEIYMSDNPVKVKKDFNTQVRELYDRGESIEEIADALGRSTQEVKFALEFS